MNFDKGYTINSSKENEIVVLGKRGASILWLYKYFKENSQKDIQSAWFKWRLPAELRFQFMSNGIYYAVVKGEDSVRLLRMDPESDVYQDDGEDYRMKLELPTFYVTKAEQQAYRADTTGSLVIHRMHLNTGLSNYYTLD